MGNMYINFDEIEGGFEPVPEGKWPVIIERVEVRESKSSDHYYLNWELAIDDDEYEGQRLWMITSLSPRALFRLKDIFEELDVIEGEMDIEWDEDIDITPESGPRLLYPEVEGMAAIATVKNEPYEGREQNRVKALVGDFDEPVPKPKRKTQKRSAQRSSGRSASRNGRVRDQEDYDDEPPRRSARKSQSSRSQSRRPQRRAMR